ncbi:GNAT family N-acetyltransferase [Psychromarinibacter sp. C21-152]|uniref:GNAT family N-acetyltransferase n=1 Tax=Psychromarinibacter sediminicola TaxID=3033385 RepID=A0AAE3T9J7_9RHOB|nr:GNAT family N-acetyltransferase [Psychromarinibacter sediminicola]MDF0600595.1 GNAT family N-acetyltransferase [Psychromarinibacter sediminicola]
MRIRPATASDAPAIAALWNPVIRDTLITFSPVEKTPDAVAADIAARTRDGHAFLVAEAETEGEGLAGFATYFQFRGGEGYARTMEHTVILAPAARGRGLGRALMAALEAHARAAGVHSIIAAVSSANPEGRAFHTAIGYEPVAILPEVGYKRGRWLDLHLMQKRL